MLGPRFSAVQSGNSDTQYSVTWFDSSKEPYILHLPNAKGRYYTFQFIDAFTNNFHYASTRTMGSQEHAYYPGVFKDTDGKMLDGSAGKYTLTFPKGKTPPVGAFWSTTMYDAKKRLMVENRINRYKIGSADKMKAGSDGSITIYIQSESPGKDKESNWLPAPKEPFYMLFRMYLPDIEVLNGQYVLPGVVKAE
jgi:hypothetical protein